MEPNGNFAKRFSACCQAWYFKTQDYKLLYRRLLELLKRIKPTEAPLATNMMLDGSASRKPNPYQLV